MLVIRQSGLLQSWAAIADDQAQAALIRAQPPLSQVISQVGTSRDAEPTVAIRARSAIPHLPLLARVALAYIGSRIVLAIVLLDRFHLHRQLWENALSVWDGKWYLRIAQLGYPSHISHSLSNLGKAGSDPAFFPVFPMIVRAVASVTGHHWIVTGVAIATGAGCGAVMALTSLVRDAAGERAGFQAGVLLAFAPASYFLSVPYADGLAIMLCAVFLLSIRREQWTRAAVFGLLATATSVLALPLVVVAAVAAFTSPDRRAWRVPFITPFGALGYFGYLWVHAGTPFGWWDAERFGWHHRLDLLSAVHWLSSRNGISVVEVLSVALAMLGIVAMWKKPLPRSWSLYSVLVLVGVVTDGALFLTPRFVMDAFGLTSAFGVALPQRWFPRAVAGSAVAMVSVALAYTVHPSFFFQP